MNVSYFSVYDKKSLAYGQVFPAPTPGAAERSFAESLKNPESMAGKYPEDFALYSCFVFDDESGVVVERFEPPRLLCEASSLV